MTNLIIRTTWPRLNKSQRRPKLLLHPNIPKPLHGVNPRSVMGQEWWDVERKKAYKKFDYHCQACGYRKNEPLHAHEAYDINYKEGIVKLKEIVALCKLCHMFIHSELTKRKYETGEISRIDFEAINEHGGKILKEANLYHPQMYRGDIADWDKWRLLIDDKSFGPKFKDINEWADYYGYDLYSSIDNELDVYDFCD